MAVHAPQQRSFVRPMTGFVSIIERVLRSGVTWKAAVMQGGNAWTNTLYEFGLTPVPITAPSRVSEVVLASRAVMLCTMSNGNSYETLAPPPRRNDCQSYSPMPNWSTSAPQMSICTPASCRFTKAGP